MSSVSFVVASRNDDHGGKMLARMRVFMETLLTLADKYHLKGELIIVEWNPPSERPRLWEALPVSVQTSHFPVRYIEVPASIHNRFRNADTIPLYQMIAKNVGIRRAKGEFVVSTAMDLLFSEELISFLSRESLDDRVFYRIDRYDVTEVVPLDLTVEERLKWCRRKKNIIRIHKRYGTIIMDKKYVIHDVSWREFIVSKIPSLIYQTLGTVLGTSPRVHTNGCGDFTMMTRKCWEELYGHPEIPIWSMHIDSILCFMADFMGLRQVILKSPMQIFHMEHKNSWANLSPEEKLSIFVEKPWLPFDVVKEIRGYMFKNKEQLVLNDEDWGLAKEDLQEHVFGNEKW